MRAAMLASLLLVMASTHAIEKEPLRYVEKVDGMLTANPLPKSEFQDKLGAALARQLGMPLKYVELPRTRVMAALENGDGDILCSYLPEWLPGDVDWTQAFIPISEVVISSPRVKPPASLAELRGKRLGTVLGFRYPELEKIVGKDYIRDDAPSSALSIRKWLNGRFDYLVTPTTVVHRQFAGGKVPHGAHVLVVYEAQTRCAVSRKSKITVAEFDAAINALDRSGELTKILRLR
ncbi:ABC-type amino acid transport substrate-binding protein [Duganella sacchari]|uniref:ABC-type amino acid transport substrate-binding protein n=1 Tax=Duganella sacchari TaxID=551987 RepID=A0A1M7Q424_9BURK|nr:MULTISPECIES: transporter substrate-binding domain-containing protein [Duganella]MYM29789.1 transporter substrate-binding domain-containing protein [Duganella sp. CY15W]SHN24984.1 ABC-type amino acid transport substrate-binding protein [Duganella sacchari]